MDKKEKFSEMVERYTKKWDREVSAALRDLIEKGEAAVNIRQINPCFCGGGGWDLNVPCVEINPARYAVFCSICGCQGPFATTRASAAALWNERRPD